jgi:hypothetical protein
MRRRAPEAGYGYASTWASPRRPSRRDRAPATIALSERWRRSSPTSLRAKIPAHDRFHPRTGWRASEHWRKRIGEALGHRPLWHIATQRRGPVVFPEAHFDMVRPGIGLHGVGVNEAEDRPAEACGLIAHAHRTDQDRRRRRKRRLRAHAPHKKEERIAILPIGYADGLSRRLSNGRAGCGSRGGPARFVGTSAWTCA